MGIKGVNRNTDKYLLRSTGQYKHLWFPQSLKSKQTSMEEAAWFPRVTEFDTRSQTKRRVAARVAIHREDPSTAGPVHPPIKTKHRWGGKQVKKQHL